MPNQHVKMMSRFRFKFIYFLRLIRNILTVLGTFFLICLLLACTSVPYRGMRWLGISKTVMDQKPGTIIFMGGGGMPSESNLMRCWFAALAAASFPESNIVIAMPGNLKDSLSTPSLIAHELETRGIESSRIIFENIGKNTRFQALECTKLIGLQEPVLLVSSPEHIRRAVLCFEKAGFEKVNGLPSFENAIEADLKFKDDQLGGNKILIPDMGGSISLRYRVWTHLQYEIKITRECFALGYYWLRGWI